MTSHDAYDDFLDYEAEMQREVRMREKERILEELADMQHEEYMLDKWERERE